jgi:transcriptional regulator GlxA family with amidase domain
LTTEAKDETNHHETAMRVISYINANLSSALSLDLLGKEFFLSKSHLNRLFKEATGTSVWEYVIRKRLLLARSLIRSGMNAGTAALQAGFCEYSTFYRMYKTHFSNSPSEDARGKSQ